MVVFQERKYLAFPFSYRNFERKTFSSTKLPEEVTLEDRVTKIFDQGKTNACTGCSFAQSLRIQKFVLPDPSPAWIYVCERLREEKVLDDSGAIPDDALKVLKETGVVSEKDYPFRFETINEIPDASLFEIAKKYCVRETYSLKPQDSDNLKHLLVRGIPISVGIRIYQSFEKSQFDVPFPKEGEKPMGRHEVLLIGYRDATKKWLFVNSWGKSWGINGFFTLDYRYLEDEYLALYADVAIV